MQSVAEVLVFYAFPQGMIQKYASFGAHGIAIQSDLH